MRVYQKTMFDHYYCKKALENFEKKTRKVYFCINIMACKSIKDSKVLRTPVPEQRLMSSYRYEITFISMHVTGDDVNFCVGLECVNVKYKSSASTACESPD